MMNTKRAALRMLGCTLYGTLMVSTALAGPQTKPGKKPAGDTALVTAGKAVYDSNHCMACHAIGTTGGKSAPALTKVGADPKHTAKWLTDEVTNPKSHKPDGKMPAYPQIQGKDLKALVAYLGSLKK